MDNHELLSRTREEWDSNVKAMDQYTVPWLNLDMDSLQQFADGKLSGFHRPCGELNLPMIGKIRRLLYGDFHSKKVLCLASGGGQQSAVFSLLGADVTVADISPEQLKGDIKAAEHYGYKVKTLLCSMTDLSVLDADSFDMVFQPISLCFVPDVLPVYREVFRVLKQGGFYLVEHINPATYPVEFDNGIDGWDGTGYRIATPYLGGAIRMDEHSRENMTDGEMTGEFRHLFIDMFCGLTEAGFSIKYVYEDERNLVHVTSDSEPEKRFSVVQKYLNIVSMK